MKLRCLIFSALALPAMQLGLTRLAEAQTSVKVNGRDITITVPIDAAGADPATAKLWKDGAEKYWNDTFKGPNNPYKGCVNLKLVVDVRPVPLNAKERPDRHMIFATGKAPTDVA